jgi:lysophospholipase L1-like esterase
MPRVALLGDSIFDNKAYVGSEPDVVGHLRRMAPEGWEFDLLAVDGNLARHVSEQLRTLSDEATHLVVSAGGNNAISNSDILAMKASSAGEVFSALADRTEAFEREYRAMLRELTSTGRPYAVCTIYYPNFSDPIVQRIAKAALAAFNDVIISQAAEHCLPILDLRLLCSEGSDYANEIEPSGRGGEKIATAILDMIRDRDFALPMARIFW